MVGEFKKLAKEKSLNKATRIYSVSEEVETLCTITFKVGSEGMTLRDILEDLRVKENIELFKQIGFLKV